jgi:carboxymethylenebutenolidase
MPGHRREAIAVRHDTLDIQTEDGTCPVHLFEPEERDPQPGVVMFMDGLGVRPALFEMAHRLSAGGYVVALPDLYYRTGFEVGDTATLFSDPVRRADWAKRILPTVSVANIMRDMPSFLALFDARSSVRPGPIGTTGYCLGGRLSLSAAGHFPDRVAAAASYHAGGLATDSADSPHRLAPSMKARVYVAGAIEDSGFDDAQKRRLEDALRDAGVDHVVETYQARHGWVPSDTAVHDPAAAERHWQTLFRLFDETLKGDVRTPAPS